MPCGRRGGQMAIFVSLLYGGGGQMVILVSLLYGGGGEVWKP